MARLKKLQMLTMLLACAVPAWGAGVLTASVTEETGWRRRRAGGRVLQRCLLRR